MPMFDPETGKVLDPDALRSLQFNGRGIRVPRTVVDRAADTKTVEVIDESSGRTAGAQVFHGSGRVDARATPVPAPLGASCPS